MLLISHIYRRSLLVLVSIFALVTLYNPVFADPALWRVQTKQNILYLFGSIHIADASIYPLTPVVESAYASSDVLVVEVDETQADQVKLNEILMTQGFYSGTDTIANHINQDTLQLLQNFLKETGIPYATVEKMRPGLIAITLSVARLVQLGYSPGLGIDRYFINKAKKDSKSIDQLETAESQLVLMLSFSDDDLMLKHTVYSLNDMDNMFKEIMNAWKSGSSERIESVILTNQLQEHPEFSDLFERLFDARNITMTSKILELLTQQKNYFIVVGAGHLVGKTGIIALLRKQGLTVERVQ